MVEIDLGANKKATINTFKGKKLLDLRVYFDKDGETRPTQKGISINGEQWLKLLQRSDEILKELGIRPGIDFKDGEAPPKKEKRKRDAKQTEEDTTKKPKQETETTEATSTLPPPSPKKKKKTLSPAKVDPEDMAQDVPPEDH